MAERVKTRRYDSSRRRAQAAATRREIIDAAGRLFEAEGYAATTMAAVGREAGVATKTVYLGFDTKGGVLRAVWNLRLRGDEEDVPVMRREWYREVVEEADPGRQLALNARNARAVKERVGGIFGVIREAAAIDREIATLLERINTEFHGAQGAIVRSLHRKRALRPGLGVARATDLLWTLNHFDVWLLLVGQRGWTPAQWERWFADTACEQLLER